MILLQRLGQILVHLSLNALLPVTHHGVSSQGNDGCPVRAHASFVVANLAGSLKSSLYNMLVKSDSNLSVDFANKGVSYHDRHLNIHEDYIKLLLFNGFNSLPTVSNHCHNVMIFL